MSVQQVQHSEYQQLAARIAELNATLQAMETQLHEPEVQYTPTRQAEVVETPLAIAAG